jgi:hypothetical protein
MYRNDSALNQRLRDVLGRRASAALDAKMKETFA